MEKNKRYLLCEDYQKDFISTHYGADDFPGRQNLLPPFISDLDDVDVVTRLAFLHIQSDIDPVGTSNLQILLKKLSEIHVMEKTIGSSTFIPSLQSTVLSPNNDKPTLGSHMVAIIESLFEALRTATLKNKEAMWVWQRSYQNIVSTRVKVLSLTLGAHMCSKGYCTLCVFVCVSVSVCAYISVPIY